MAQRSCRYASHAWSTNLPRRWHLHCKAAGRARRRFSRTEGTAVLKGGRRGCCVCRPNSTSVAGCVRGRGPASGAPSGGRADILH
uniref:Uncharacterized protein n=1 Tax=Setaria viridis TaxID=4556 RepID=A0A4U6TPD4_SETVI|nr:hypothetical protein SEVIR_7G034600v2 [Setaria viridis]